jgi:DNA-binding NtrC family response regulator
MVDDALPPPQGYATARTGPARPGEGTGPVPSNYAGLVLLYSPDYRRLPAAVPFDRAEVTLGRDASCTVVVDDVAVSRRHARIESFGPRWRLVDLDSRNGTFVDGVRVSQLELEHLHEVRIGDALFKFVETDALEYGQHRLDGARADGRNAAPGSEPLGSLSPSPAMGTSTPSSELLGGYAMRRLVSEIARIAPTELSCVVLGETGTGKEVVAREIHRLSGRQGAFQAIHCAAIPKELLESELFGHKRGAFSGAHRDKVGLIAQAHKGTLFLDEIGDMPLDAQVKLLRVLQSHEVLPVGATLGEPVDLRVVCATHRDLYRYVQEGKFRGDLFARINEYVTILPPLRERKEDIFLLATTFAARAGGATRRFEPSFGFLMALLQYDWPFNVRELQGVMKRACALADDAVLEVKHLPPALTLASPDAPAHSLEPSPIRAPSVSPPKDLSLTAKTPSSRADLSDDGFERGPPTEGKLRELLTRCGGNVAAVARELGKGRMQVHRWMRRYGLAADDYRPR